MPYCRQKFKICGRKRDMYSRKQQDQELINLPSEWLSDLTDLLNTTYRDQCNKGDKTFLALGHTFPNEVILIISFLDERNLSSVPITVLLSVDLDKKSDSKKILENLVEFVGIVFDEIFSQEDWNDYNSIWEKESLGECEIYYMISRENVILSMKADELLKK